jgi:ATP-dependent DNA helicase RecG
MGRSEELGTGVKNVFRYSLVYSGNDNILFNERDVFTTTVPLLSVKQDSEINEGVNEGVNSLYNQIKRTPLKRTPYFAEQLNTSQKNIERWIKILKKQDKIVFIGNPKTGGYKTK